MQITSAPPPRQGSTKLSGTPGRGTLSPSLVLLLFLPFFRAFDYSLVIS